MLLDEELLINYKYIEEIYDYRTNDYYYFVESINGVYTYLGLSQYILKKYNGPFDKKEYKLYLICG